MADLLWLRDIAEIAVRGFLLVMPVSASTYFIAHGHLRAAFLASFCISFTWWLNAGTAAVHPGVGWACVYGLGAACGTIAGQRLARRLVR